MKIEDFVCVALIGMAARLLADCVTNLTAARRSRRIMARFGL